MRRQTLAAVGTAFAVMATMTAGASARTGDRTVTQTYPVATALCVKAHTAALPPKLESKKAQVITTCDTLVNAFAPLVSTVDGAEATLLSAISAQKALVAAACPKPVTDAAACTAARATQKTVDDAARTTEHAAVGAYHAAIEANRMTFWSAIGTLRGSSST
jgi:hypothetical protein